LQYLIVPWLRDLRQTLTHQQQNNQQKAVEIICASLFSAGQNGNAPYNSVSHYSQRK